MQLLKKRILQDGKCYEGGILKVDGFINHQMDPVLMKSIGVEFVRRFAATNVNKIMTIEASGIAPAIMTGYLMDLPVVFAKKKSPKTIQNALSTTVHSFTKDRDYEVVISADFLTHRAIRSKIGRNGIHYRKSFPKRAQNTGRERRQGRKPCHHRRPVQLLYQNKRSISRVGVEIMPLAFGLFTILHRLLRTHMITCQAGGAVIPPGRLSVLHRDIPYRTTFLTPFASDTVVRSIERLGRHLITDK